jgi:F0F1-type ATP synthase epsilon subunit|tara:strand:- start:100 stop:360 length:261 start_codon:yes stop_codon:yes gene_type:complete
MSEKVNKIEDQELKTVKEQTGKLQQCIMDLGSLEVRKTEIMQAYAEFLKELDVTKKELEEKYGQVNINLQDGSYEEVKEEEKSEEK